MVPWRYGQPYRRAIWLLQDATAPPGPQGFDCIQNGKPYAYGNLPTVALNIAQEVADNRAACGQCLLLAGTGTGAGLNPISSSPTK